MLAAAFETLNRHPLASGLVGPKGKMAQIEKSRN
jgi:hypothetical protein